MIQREDAEWGVQLKLRPFPEEHPRREIEIRVELKFPRPKRGVEVRVWLPMTYYRESLAFPDLIILHEGLRALIEKTRETIDELRGKTKQVRESQKSANSAQAEPKKRTVKKKKKGG